VGRVAIWKTTTGKVVRRIELDKALSWRPAEGEPVATGPQLTTPPTLSSYALSSAAITLDGKWLALPLQEHRADIPGGGIVSTDYLSLWDVGTGKLLWIRHTPNSTDALAFSPDGKMLAVGASSTIQLWDAGTGTTRDLVCDTPDDDFRYVGRPGRLAFTPDGKTLVAGNGGKRVYLWDTATGKERQSFVAHPGRVLCVSVSPDGKTLATSSEDTTALLWELSRK
jgi:WD40 repeat protein